MFKLADSPTYQPVLYYYFYYYYYACRKILELEEELKVVGNAMKSLEIFEQEVGGSGHKGYRYTR